jgi:hypothetical protein
MTRQMHAHFLHSQKCIQENTTKKGENQRCGMHVWWFENARSAICQSVSQCILGSRLPCIFTEQRRHYSTLLGPTERTPSWTTSVESF